MLKSTFTLLAITLFTAGLSSPSYAQNQVSTRTITRLLKVDTGVYRGSQPVTDEDFKTLQSLGIKTSISLRWDEYAYYTEKDLAAKYGIEVIHFPMSADLVPLESEVSQILKAMIDPAKQPVFVHCKLGKDRTGLIVGEYRIQKMGWSAQQAYSEMRSIGYNPWLLPLDAFFLNHSHPGDIPLLH